MITFADAGDLVSKRWWAAKDICSQDLGIVRELGEAANGRIDVWVASDT